MKAGIIDLRTARQPNSLLFTDRQVKDFLEENADLYWEQVRKIGKEFAPHGVLVTDAKLHHGLYLFHAQKRVHDDKVLDIIQLPRDFPGEEFVCLELGFRVPVLGNDFVAWKWFFFRQPKQFRGAGIVRSAG